MYYYYGFFHGLPPTRGEGQGTVRVENIQPVPIPGLTLPVTRRVLPTRDNHYE